LPIGGAISVANVFLGVVVVPMAVLCVAALAGSASRHRQNNLIATGQRASGRVLAAGRDNDGTGDLYHWVRVQYDYDGPVTVKVVVSKRDQGRYRVGQRVGLTYAPSRSQLVRLDPPV
jgi:Protein of unknown function (DUF3592)